MDRDRYQKQLTKLLELADVRSLCTLAWATIAIQSGRVDVVPPSMLRYPREAITTSIADRYSIHPWKIETLINEALAINTKIQRRSLDCRQFGAIATLSNSLGKLENAYDGMDLINRSALDGMGRLAQRQFEWQRGFLNVPNLFRSYYVYGGAICQEHFLSKYDVTISEFSLVCFALRAMYQKVPYIRQGGGMPLFGVDHKKLERIWKKIALPRSEMSRLATRLRRFGGHISYRRSVLRLFPCVQFEEDRLIGCPVPDLLTARSTSGLYYDLVDDSDSRNEIGRRFEEYALELFRSHLCSATVNAGFKYEEKKGRNQETPDVLISRAAEIELVCECKATRMTYDAKFGTYPLEQAEREYTEIAKAVFQIWKFANHVRAGVCRSASVSSRSIGVVLTLDAWLTADVVIRPRIFEMARAMAKDKGIDIQESDQLPVLFLPIEDLEATVRVSTEASFSVALEAAVTKEYEGWALRDVHRAVQPDLKVDNDYPFAERLSEVMPWKEYIE
jgi:hypothetical protein